MEIGPETAVGDANRLRQSLYIVLRTAMDFCKGSPISVKVRTELRDNVQVLMEMFVRPQTVGVEPDTSSGFFEKFQLATKDMSDDHPTAVGLRLSRKLAELMGGGLTVNRHEGGDRAVSLHFLLRATA